MNYIYRCKRCKNLFLTRGTLTVCCSNCKCISVKHVFLEDYYERQEAVMAMRNYKNTVQGEF